MAATGTQAVSAAAGATAGGAAATEETRIREYIDSRYSASDVQHSYQTELGEDIDCIDYYAQPSIKAMLAAGRSKAEVTAPKLSDVAQALGGSNPDFAAAVARAGSSSTRDASGRLRQCPEGSVPTLRLSAEKIRAVGGLDQYLRPRHREAPEPTPPAMEVPGYMHVAGVFNTRLIAGGATATSVYDPNGSSDFIHSVSQSWLIGGSNASTGCAQCTSDCKQTVESGWEVEPSTYGDTLPHLFVFATADGYWTNCLNSKDCVNNFGQTLPMSSPWTQIGGDMSAGQALAASLIGTTPPLELGIWTFNYQGWWLVFAGPTVGIDSLYGGYRSAFYSGGALAGINSSPGSSSNIAAKYQVGGEVQWNLFNSLDPIGQGMGSGVPALLPSSSPYGLYAYHRNTLLVTAMGGLQTEPTQPFDQFFQGDPNCYNMQTSSPGGSWGAFFYFGGAGKICFGSTCNACCSSSDSACQTLEAAEQQVKKGC